LQILADERRVHAPGHLADLDLADLDDRLVRRVLGAADELGRELLERLLEVALPEAVRLHRVPAVVQNLDPVLHGAPPPSRGGRVRPVQRTTSGAEQIGRIEPTGGQERAELPEPGRLDLADALARQSEPLADGLELLRLVTL